MAERPRQHWTAAIACSPYDHRPRVVGWHGRGHHRVLAELDAGLSAGADATADWLGAFFLQGPRRGGNYQTEMTRPAVIQLETEVPVSVDDVARPIDTAAAIDLDQLLRQHEPWLRTVIQARCRYRDEVDDIFQEVAVAAVLGVSRLRDAAKAAPWLYRVAIYQCLMHRRSEGRRRQRWERASDSKQQQEEVSQATADPIRWLLSQERERLVQQAICRLPDRDAEVLLWKYEHAWSCRQIARHMGLTESAVQARLFRARQRLRAWLADAAGDY